MTAAVEFDPFEPCITEVAAIRDSTPSGEELCARASYCWDLRSF
jgi:hypothetical protein